MAINIDIQNDEIISVNDETAACLDNPLALSTQASIGEISHWVWSTGETASSIDATNVQTYEVTVTNTMGCQYSAQFVNYKV